MRAHCLAKCLNVARRPGCFPKISTQLPGNCGGITLKPIHWWESSTAQSCSASLGANVDEPHDRNIERSEEHTSELQSLMRISYAVLCVKKKHTSPLTNTHIEQT